MKIPIVHEHSPLIYFQNVRPEYTRVFWNIPCLANLALTTASPSTLSCPAHNEVLHSSYSRTGPPHWMTPLTDYITLFENFKAFKTADSHQLFHATCLCTGIPFTLNWIPSRSSQAMKDAFIMAFLYISPINNYKNKQSGLPFSLVVYSPAGRAMCIACVALIAATMFFLVVVVFNPLKN